MAPRNDTPRRSAARFGFATTTIVTVVQIASQILSVAILSRLLAPADFGSTAAPIAIATGLALFVEYGFGANVIQRQDDDRRFVGTAFSAVLGLGVAATAIMAATAPLVGRALGATEPWMVGLCAPLLFFLPIASFVESLLLRDLDYRTVFWGNFLSTVIGQLAIPVGLAAAGAGPAALILSQLVTPILKIAVMARRPCIPKPAFDRDMLRQMLSFSTYFTLTRFFNFVALQGDRVVLSAIANEGAVGFYVRAQHFSQIIITLLTSALEKVLFPLLAALRDDRSRIAALYLDTSRLTGIVTGLAAFGAAVYSDLMIRILLGPQWQDTVPLARIFSAMIMLRGLDRAASMLMRNEKTVIERCLLQFGFAVVTLAAAAVFGAVDFRLVAATIVVGAVLGQVYTILITRRYLEIPLREAATPFAVSVAAVGVVAATHFALLVPFARLGLGDEAARAAALFVAYLVAAAVLFVGRERLLGPRLASALRLPPRRRPDRSEGPET